MSFTHKDVKRFWCEAGHQPQDKDGLSPTARDPYLQYLIEEFILSRLSKNDSVLDIGCGDAVSTLRFAAKVKSIVGLDYSCTLLDRARKNVEQSCSRNIKLFCNDVTNISVNDFTDLNCVISVRCLINIPSKKLQYSVIQKVADILPVNGYFFCSEGSIQGLEGLNRRRRLFGLSEIKIAQYNNFFDQEEFEQFIKKRFRIIERKNLGFYLYLSRVVHPLLVYPRQPRHKSRFNEIFMRLQLEEHSTNFQDCGYTWVYVLKKK